jgi:hypothetical protein
LIRYIVNDAKSKDGIPNIYTHNIRGTTQESWVQEFMENESFRKYPRSNQSYLYHEIISISAHENLNNITKEMLDDLAQKYISLRGHEGVYIGAVHADKQHIHFHFCASGVEYRTGKAFRLSKQKLYQLKKAFQEYHKQKYPELSNSFCQHGKGKSYATDREWQAQNRSERTLLKTEIEVMLKTSLEKAKTQSEFLELLRSEGLHYYERSGKANGVIYNDMKFRFSRFNIDLQKLDSNNKEEEKVFASIQSLREKSKCHDKEQIENDRNRS